MDNVCRGYWKTLGIWGEHSEALFLLSVHVGFDDLQVCTDPGIPKNGFRMPSGGVFFESSVTQLHYQDRFKLKGSAMRLCMKHLKWTLGWVPSDKPMCVQEGKVLPHPHPTTWKPLTWWACGHWGTGLGARLAGTLGCTLLQSWSCSLMEEPVCEVRAGAGEKCIWTLQIIILLLCLNYHLIYHHFCQCKRATQITLGLFISTLPTQHLCSSIKCAGNILAPNCV